MILTFRIQYSTSWGEELKLVSGGRVSDMRYLPGGYWEAEMSADGKGGGAGKMSCGTEYHYECWRDGRMIRREWRNHTVPEVPGGKKTAKIADSWIDIPEAAPFCTSAFADKVLCRENVTPEELYRSGWKCAGTAVPVFSLRTEDSFGTGDFHDLEKLVDWVAATGQRVIQLLPVNDTTMTGTWMDSYPYSANSIYALHPQYIYLPDMGVRKCKSYKAVQAELEALPQVDYERVNKEKDKWMRKAFARTWPEVRDTREYRLFLVSNMAWLDAYCAFRILLARTGTADSSCWGEYSVYSDSKVRKFLEENREEADYHSFVQYHLHRQLRQARDYARSRGVILKGDLPIGVSRYGVDAWQNPSQFNMDSQAGAPPDAFASDGQMWGFPTYNWDKMAGDGFAWWKRRLGHMEQYFDAFRIDHILGFFRIWEIPRDAGSGLLGHFLPALPLSAEELGAKGFDMSSGAYVGDGADTLFIEDPRRPGWWHPRISAQDTDKYRALTEPQKEAYDRLYNDFFYHRHDLLWRESALRKLPELLASTRMLACGEDLGMIPGCVPEVMREQRILSLEIQRMPKDSGSEFADTWSYPHLSVCATSTHDMSPLRAWWREDREVTRHFWRNVLGRQGEPPAECGPEVCRSIIMMHLQSKSMFAILPVQDYLSLRPELCSSVPEDERINDPSVTPHYWRYRMKSTLETLLTDDITPYLKSLIGGCGRM